MLQDLSVSDDWVKALILDAGTITDEGVESIAKLTNLSHLRLRHSPIGDAGLSLIAGCQSLQILNLPQCGASAEGVALLARLPNLRNLRLGGPQLSAAAARSVAAIKSLRNIHLYRRTKFFNWTTNMVVWATKCLLTNHKIY